MTGSVGVVTINLPRLALKSSDEAAFRTGLVHLMEQLTKPTVIQQIINAVGKLLDTPKARRQPAQQVQK